MNKLYFEGQLLVTNLPVNLIKFKLDTALGCRLNLEAL